MYLLVELVEVRHDGDETKQGDDTHGPLHVEVVHAPQTQHLRVMHHGNCAVGQGRTSHCEIVV